MLKYSRLIILCIVFDLGVAYSKTIEQKNETVINEVLFSIADESLTSHDRKVYQAVLGEIFQKSKISQFTNKLSDDFILSRLSYKEAKVFELEGVVVKVSEASKKKLSEFSQTEIDYEVEIISKALALIEIKETQLKQKDRFDTWFELIKHKYQLKLKSVEVK